VELLRLREDDISKLEEEARQIFVDCASSDDDPRRKVQQMKANIIVLLEHSNEHIQALRKLVSSRVAFNDELSRVVDSVHKMEVAVTRRHLTRDVDSVDSEVSRLVSIGRQVDTEFRQFAEQLTEQETMYAELGAAIPIEVQGKIDELKTAYYRLKVCFTYFTI